MKTNGLACNENEFRCSWFDGQRAWPYCVPLAWKCNKIVDCYKSVDEDPKTCSK